MTLTPDIHIPPSVSLTDKEQCIQKAWAIYLLRMIGSPEPQRVSSAHAFVVSIQFQIFF